MHVQDIALRKICNTKMTFHVSQGHWHNLLVQYVMEILLINK